MEDTFTCNIDGQTTLEVCDNADGENILVSTHNKHNGALLVIALSADQARALAYALNVYAAGV